MRDYAEFLDIREDFQNPKFAFLSILQTRNVKSRFFTEQNIWRKDFNFQSHLHVDCKFHEFGFVISPKLVKKLDLIRTILKTFAQIVMAYTMQRP